MNGNPSDDNLFFLNDSNSYELFQLESEENSRETSIPRPAPLPSNDGPYSPLQNVTPEPPPSPSAESVASVATPILTPRLQSPTNTEIYSEIKTLAPVLTPDTINQICKKSDLPLNELLEILKKINQYEQMGLPTGQKIYKDEMLNLTDPNHEDYPYLNIIFNEKLPRSLININNEWFILMKGKGDSNNLNIEGGFNRATLGINPKNGQLVIVRSGLYIDNPNSSADSKKEIEMMQKMNTLIDKREQEGDTSIPFLKSEHLVYYGRLPSGGRGQRLKRDYNPTTFPNLIDSFAHPIYQKILFVTPYCERGNLANLLKNKSLTEEERLNASKALAKAVYLLHKNSIIHVDLKPDNLVMNEKGEVKLIDFGLSDLEENFKQKEQGTTGYKPLYDSFFATPEFRLGFAHDLFSLGVTLGELFFDDKLKNIIIKYNNKTSETDIANCKNELEALINNYESRTNTHARVIAQLIRLCVDLDPNAREETHEGLPKIEYIMNELNKLT